MPEQPELNNFASAAASTPGQTIFKTEMFGFKRDEVLACIERMTSENLERQKNLEITISHLQEKLNAAARDNDTLLHKTKQVCDDLAAEKLRADAAAEQVAKLRIELEKATDNVTACRSQLALKEQEATSLKADNVRLNSTVNSLTATISDYENRKEQLEQKLVMVRSEADNAVVTARQRAEAVRREAEAQAMVIKAKAEDEARVLTAQARQQKTDAKKMIADAADNIAASIVILKSQLAGVDEKISAATGNLQKATGSISAALDNTEKDLVMLGVQMEKFPTPIPPIAPASIPQPAAAPIMSEKVPVLSYTQSPSQQNTMHTQQRAAYTQNYDAFDAQRAAYEAQQRDAYNRQMQQNYYEQQRAAYEAQQRAAFEAQQRAEYEAQQREAYARAQQEVYDRQVREAYERQMQAAFEQRQREMQEKMQREAYERQQREELERQQRAAYEAQQRAVFDAQQRASYERSQREAYAQQTTGVYGQPHYPQPQPFSAFPQQAYPQAGYMQPPYVQQPVYDAPPVYPLQSAPPAPSAPLTGSYVPQPTPVAPAEVESFSAPPEPKNVVAQQPDVTTFTPAHIQNTASSPTPYAAAPRAAAPAPYANSPAQSTAKTFGEEVPHAPVAPAPVAQQSAPFANQQAFSAPKEMQNMEQTKRTVQPRRTPPRPRATLSDALIDGLSNLLNK